MDSGSDVAVVDVVAGEMMKMMMTVTVVVVVVVARSDTFSVQCSSDR